MLTCIASHIAWAKQLEGEWLWLLDSLWDHSMQPGILLFVGGNAEPWRINGLPSSLNAFIQL